MLKLPAFRFSLLSLLLVFTLAAVSVSHWVTWQKLLHEQIKVEDLRQQVRVRNDKLGVLTIDDRSQVHVILTERRYEQLDAKKRVGPRGFSWDVYLPAANDWRLCWAFGDVSPFDNNVPTVIHGYQVLGMDAAENPTRLDINLERDSPKGWKTTVSYGDDSWSHPIPEQMTDWIDPAQTSPSVQAGHERHYGVMTESYSPSAGPIVLLNLWKYNSRPSTGVVVWLVPDDPQRSE